MFSLCHLNVNLVHTAWRDNKHSSFLLSSDGRGMSTAFWQYYCLNDNNSRINSGSAQRICPLPTHICPIKLSHSRQFQNKFMFHYAHSFPPFRTLVPLNCRTRFFNTCARLSLLTEASTLGSAVRRVYIEYQRT